MANAVLQINNETTGALSLDIRFDKFSDRVIRSKLNARGTTGASVDVGDITTLEELNRNPQFRSLWDANKVSLTVNRGSSDVPGAIDQVADSVGMGGIITCAFPYAAAGAGARDITLYSANFPFAAKIIDYQVMVSTSGVGAIQLRDATDGAGNTLSQGLSQAVAGRVRDDGTGQTAGSGVVPTLAKGGTLVAREAVGTTAGTIIVTFQRLS